MAEMCVCVGEPVVGYLVYLLWHGLQCSLHVVFVLSDSLEVPTLQTPPRTPRKRSASGSLADAGSATQGLSPHKSPVAQTEATPTAQSKSVQKDSQSSIAETIAELTRVMSAIQESISPVKKPDSVTIIPPLVDTVITIDDDDDDSLSGLTPEVDSSTDQSSDVVICPELPADVSFHEDHCVEVLAPDGHKGLPAAPQAPESMLAEPDVPQSLPSASDNSVALITQSEGPENLPKTTDHVINKTSPDLIVLSSKVPVIKLHRCDGSPSGQTGISGEDSEGKGDSQFDQAGPDHQQLELLQSVCVKSHNTKPNESCENVQSKANDRTEQRSADVDINGANGENGLTWSDKVEGDGKIIKSDVPKTIPAEAKYTLHVPDNDTDVPPLVVAGGTIKLVPLEVSQINETALSSSNVVDSNHAKTGSLFGEPGSRDVAANGRVLFENVEVAVGEEEEDVQVSFTWDPSTLAGFDAEEFSDEEDLVELCVVKAIQK